MVEDKVGAADVLSVRRPNETEVAIIGSGPFAQGLCSLVEKNMAYESYNVCLGSRRLAIGEESSIRGLPHVPVLSITAAIAEAAIVVLAIPSSAHKGFVKSHGQALAGKTVVDCSNPSRKELQELATAAADSSELSSQVDLDSEDAALKVGQTHTVLPPQSALAAKSKHAGARRLACQGLRAAVARLPGCARKGSKGDVPSVAEHLQAQLGASCTVVKALSNLSAPALLNTTTFATYNLRSAACSDDALALDKVKAFCKAIGIELKTVDLLKYARRMEGVHMSLYPAWQGAWWFIWGLFIVAAFYKILVSNIIKGQTNWTNWFVDTNTRTAGDVAITGYAITFLPGVLLPIWQLLTRRSRVQVPTWMKRWLESRKQLGLMSFGFMIWHCLGSVIMFGPGFTGGGTFAKSPNLQLAAINGTAKAPVIPNANLAMNFEAAVVPIATNLTQLGVTAAYAALPAGRGTAVVVKTVVSSPYNGLMNSTGEIAVALAFIALMAFTCVAISSLDTVASKLNWREWHFVQSYVGWFAFACGLAHVLVIDSRGWAKKLGPGLWPPIDFLACILPMLAFALKVFGVFPGISCLIQMAKRGDLDRRSSKAAPFAAFV